jgi:hypothetical protein
MFGASMFSLLRNNAEQGEAIDKVQIEQLEQVIRSSIYLERTSH